MKEKQLENVKLNGIAVAKAKNVKFGRPKTPVPDNFEEVYTKWKNGSILGKQAMELTGLKRNKFYDFVKIYEKKVRI